MLLKRHYHRDGHGALVDPPRVSHLEVKHTGTHAAQRFSTRLVAAGLAEGWMSLQGDMLTLHALPEALRYRVLRVPGRYPSLTEPSGSEVIHYYDCVLDEAQHAEYRAGKAEV